MRNIPSFSSLRAFESAARLGSFKLAAQELNLSTSAISHQIRTLEALLGVLLFERHGAGTSLNDEGRQYLNAVRVALSQLESATVSLQKKTRSDILRVSLLSSFSTLWLIPRLDYFQSRHPDIEIELIDDVELTDFSTSICDAAIRYDFTGKGQWPDLVSHPLLEEFVFPVCSQDFLVKYPEVTKSLRTGQFPLLINKRHPDEWDVWFGHLGLEFDTGSYSHKSTMDTSNMTLKAASQGLGVALARTPFADQYMETGSLVSIHSGVQSRGVRNYFVYPAVAANNRNLACFRDWLMQESETCNERLKTLFTA